MPAVPGSIPSGQPLGATPNVSSSFPNGNGNAFAAGNKAFTTNGHGNVIQGEEQAFTNGHNISNGTNNGSTIGHLSDGTNLGRAEELDDVRPIIIPN